MTTPEQKLGWGIKNPLKAFGPAGSLFGTGIQLAATIVILFFLGHWLDKQLDTTPWLMIVGGAVGIVGGLLKFVRTVCEVSKKEEQEKKEKKGQ